MPIISISNLSKAYVNGTKALDDVNLEVAEGENPPATKIAVRKKHTLGFYNHQDLILDLFPGVRSLTSTSAQDRSPELLFSCMDWDQRLEQCSTRPAPQANATMPTKKSPRTIRQSGLSKSSAQHKKGSFAVAPQAVGIHRGKSGHALEGVNAKFYQVFTFHKFAHVSIKIDEILLLPKITKFSF